VTVYQDLVEREGTVAESLPMGKADSLEDLGERGLKLERAELAALLAEKPLQRAAAVCIAGERADDPGRIGLVEGELLDLQDVRLIELGEEFDRPKESPLLGPVSPGAEAVCDMAAVV
jgi:hypothetical protein